MQYAEADRLLNTVDAHFADTSRFTGIDSLSAPIRQAMAMLDRQQFLPAAAAQLALNDTALPIGEGQTISQPFIVALMTQLLSPQPYAKVLEIGTGSGYQAAVLASLVNHVVSLEIIPRLATMATENLQRADIPNVEVYCADGYFGWPQGAPYDGIIITAALNEIPPDLLDQLREGGRMVLPMGKPSGIQQLMTVEKLAGGGIDCRQVLPVNFVPFTRLH